jgi:beta-barrel assembly-enhancing protease
MISVENSVMMESRSVAAKLPILILALAIASPFCAEELATASSRPQAGTAPAASPAKASLADVTYDQVKPSQTFVGFDQATFVITHPENWKASIDGTSARIAPEAGAAQDVIAYGVAIATVPTSGSLADSTDTLIQALEKSNPGMHALDDPRKIRVGPLRGRAANLAGNSPVLKDGQPLPERDWLVTLPRPDGSMLYLVFIAPEKDFSQLRPTFQRMLDSVQLK